MTMKRMIKKSVATILLVLVLLSAFPATAFAIEYPARLTAPNGEPYYTRQLNVYAQSGYGMPNCVAYAYGRLYELNGEAPKLNRGDAGQWWYINKANGYYDYGSEPRLGAVACWSNHVAVVEAINDETNAVTVSESHWGGTYFNTKTFYNMHSHYGQAFYGYIYAYTTPEDIAMNHTPEEKEPAYKMEDTYFHPQEMNCFNALEFATNKNVKMNPTTNSLFK